MAGVNFRGAGVARAGVLGDGKMSTESLPGFLKSKTGFKNLMSEEFAWTVDSLSLFLILFLYLIENERETAQAGRGRSRLPAEQGA